MTKPDITLERSKGVVSEMAAGIYSAHIVRGDVRDGEETKWIERSIREAVRIAKTVDASIETDDTSVEGEASSTPGGEAPAPRVEGSTEKSELDAVIEEALSGEAPPTYGTNGG